jgi:hypothetical protein
MMADDVQDLSEYREAIEGMLLDGEDLEATFPTGPEIRSKSDHGPQAVGITTHRLIICHRRLDRGSEDWWRFSSVLYSTIIELGLTRTERFHRNRIDRQTDVIVHYGRQHNGAHQELTLAFLDNAVAREAHDRILAHMLAI